MKLVFALLGWGIISVHAFGFHCSDSTKANDELKPIRFLLKNSGTRYFQVTFMNQVWVRWNESNNGTLVYGEPKNETFDVGLRRTRIQLFGQVSERTFLYFQYGQNNFNHLSQISGNRKVAAFFHDVLCEYRFSPENELKVGGGLTICNGLSRFSQPSVSTIATLDVPVFAQATVDQTDEFSRKLSVYARGQIGKIDYRFSLSDPFSIHTSGFSPELFRQSTFAGKKHHLQYQGYVIYQFLQHEPHTTPYMAGTYLGDKKIFNVAGGVIYQPYAMWRKHSISDTLYEDMLLFAIESFLDVPLPNQSGAINAYAGFFNYNFGENYLRYNGIMNPANGLLNTANAVTNAGKTFGNAYPMMGSGNIFYLQTAYLLPKKFTFGKKLLNIFSHVSIQNFNRIGYTTVVYESGINYFLEKHHSKFSLSVQNRPVFTEIFDMISTQSRKNSLILQFQIFI